MGSFYSAFHELKFGKVKILQQENYRRKPVSFAGATLWGVLSMIRISKANPAPTATTGDTSGATRGNQEDSVRVRSYLKSNFYELNHWLHVGPSVTVVDCFFLQEASALNLRKTVVSFDFVSHTVQFCLLFLLFDHIFPKIA